MKLRRTMLFIPGNNPGMIQNAGVLDADSIILDLEDAVSISEKDSARNLVTKAIRKVDFCGSEVVVRINPLTSEFGYKDLEEIAKVKPDAIIIPKADFSQVKVAAKVLDSKEKEMGYDFESIKLIPLIESAIGVEKVYDIIEASTRNVAILFGGEDYTADMGVKRTFDGEEIFYARNRVAIACRAMGIDSIDTPFTDIENIIGLYEDTLKACNLGFTGKAAINPRQIEKIHKAFAPGKLEIEYALRVLEAMKIAEEEGKGVFSLDGKMIDAPIINRAQQIISLAKLLRLV